MRKSCVVFTERVNNRTVHHWPSNFYLELDGTTVESEFQAMKAVVIGKPLAAVFIRGCSPYMAKQHGRALHMDARQRALWDRKKRDIMHKLVQQKFKDHPELAELLLATGSGNIVEENFWHDDFWGHCGCRKCFWKIGKNLLGESLMAVREELGGEPTPQRAQWGDVSR